MTKNDVDPLWMAIEHDHPEDLRRLLASGRPPTYDDPSGWTPLHHAVDVEGDAHNQAGAPLDLRLVGLLLDAGAEAGAVFTDPAGRRQTPWMLAADYQHQAAMEVLSAHGGGPDREV